MKDQHGCLWKNVSNMQTVQLINNYMTDHAQVVIEFYFNTNSNWHLMIQQISYAHHSSLVDDFDCHSQWSKESEDLFTDEQQILSWKVISMKPKWKAEDDEALKTQCIYH